ncbi:Oxygen-dependent choline dehydrogenase [Lachnellula suecica]|uniref:Oxygen-dependent choline dehydrogenase n=1 Tax=Lachnellula suecica TaxID=602035 RepID=A0A8T9CJI0_9HELO|nr:Oxygen-dependent choline dehydrogenase [Lachnellula suecica]
MRASWGLSLLSLFALSTVVVAQEDAYDYIVVGSGPAGGTLASQLARGGASVLLLEAGDDQGENLSEEIAGLSFLTLLEPAMRWDFFVKYHSDDELTSKYEHLTWKTTEGGYYVGLDPPAGAKQLGVYYPRAGTLGGCSTTDAMISVLPADSDWQQIVDLTGDESWSPESMRRHFMSLERAHSIPHGTPGHGWEGFLDMTLNSNENMQNQSQLLHILTAAAEALGQDPAKILEYTQADLNNADPDRDHQVGVYGPSGHRDLKGRRVSSRTIVADTWKATKPDGSKKYNLTIGFHSLVTKLLVETGDKFEPKAIGVEYLLGQSMYAADPRYDASVEGETKQAFAKEVILSSGVFNSPQILKLSGIGPKAELEKFDIPVIVNLPGVGANLQDTPEIGFFANVSSDFTRDGLDCTLGAPGDPCIAAWKGGRGPYAQGPTNTIMLKSSVADERDIFMSLLASPSFTFRGYWPLESVNEVAGIAPNTIEFSMLKMYPNSQMGTVELLSANPRDVPDVNFRLLEGPGGDEDLQALQDGIAFGRKVMSSIAAPLGPSKEFWPCPGEEECDEAEIVRTQTWAHHGSSTCMIGADDNPLAVLDSKFRVRGVQGLRVVDASVFPRTPGSFPLIPTFMLGMKAAETILEASPVTGSKASDSQKPLSREEL